MLKSAQSSLLKMKKSIVVFAFLNFAVYIVLFFTFRAFGLLHFSGLRMLNYITLGVICCYQVSHWVKQGGGYIPFLESFCTAFFTGTLSYVLFAIFIFLYSLGDPYFAKLYFNEPDGTLKLVPFIIIFFEGSAGSLIIGLITMMYSEQYKEKV